MPTRRDFLKECHSQVVGQVKEPLTFDMFSGAYCTRCLQPECTRSTHGSTKFDQRVASWEDRLFLKVPRMDPNDPRFESISRKEFSPVQDTLIVHGWGTESEPDPPRAFVPEPAQEVAIEEILTTKEPPPVYSKTDDSSPSISRDTLLMNTPVTAEQYLPGAPKQPVPVISPKKNVDSWGAAEQSTPSEVVVNAGATVRFGSGSGVSK
jgi:hypothetical protein